MIQVIALLVQLYLSVLSRLMLPLIKIQSRKFRCMQSNSFACLSAKMNYLSDAVWIKINFDILNFEYFVTSL